jgi:predicted ribosome quality control (RQC) complex YloA/Tae2 family protein
VVRVPFDSVVLSSVLGDIRPFVGGLVQGVRQPDEYTLCLGLYRGGATERDARETMLLLSCDPTFYRVHLSTRRPPNPPQPPGLCAALRARVDGATLIEATQIGADRLLILRFEGAKASTR